jgi:hypothetical protein
MKGSDIDGGHEQLRTTEIGDDRDPSLRFGITEKASFGITEKASFGITEKALLRDFRKR